MLKSNKRKFSFFALFSFALLACYACSMNDRSEKNLSENDLVFIRELGILDADEAIELFETNAGEEGYKQAGNFITNKRVASYWIKEREREIHSAFYREIDSIKLIDKTSSLINASELKIYKSNGKDFSLYIDADSSRVYNIYYKVKERFNQYK